MKPFTIDSTGMISVPGGRYSAEQVDDLIYQLALTRAQMTPPVSDTVPKVGQLLTVEDPTIRMAALPGSPLLSLCFRHPSFGWQLYNFSVDGATRFHDALGSFLRKGDRRPNPFPSGDDRSH